MMSYPAEETSSVIIAILLMSFILSAPFFFGGNFSVFPEMLVFSVIIFGVSILSKKLMASMLDADAEHRIWYAGRYWFSPRDRLQNEIPLGVLVPVITSVITLGNFPFLAFLTYETSVLKRRAAKRFGTYSFTEMTDWHNAWIGAAGIIAVLIIAVISYFSDYGLLAKISILYAVANMVPLSNLDGTQIFFGSRVLWTTLAVITLIFFAYALFLV